MKKREVKGKRERKEENKREKNTNTTRNDAQKVTHKY